MDQQVQALDACRRWCDATIAGDLVSFVGWSRAHNLMRSDAIIRAAILKNSPVKALKRRRPTPYEATLFRKLDTLWVGGDTILVNGKGECVIDTIDPFREGVVLMGETDMTPVRDVLLPELDTPSPKKRKERVKTPPSSGSSGFVAPARLPSPPHVLILTEEQAQWAALSYRGVRVGSVYKVHGDIMIAVSTVSLKDAIAGRLVYGGSILPVQITAKRAEVLEEVTDLSLDWDTDSAKDEAKSMVRANMDQKEYRKAARRELLSSILLTLVKNKFMKRTSPVTNELHMSIEFDADIFGFTSTTSTRLFNMKSKNMDELDELVGVPMWDVLDHAGTTHYVTAVRISVSKADMLTMISTRAMT